MKEYKRTDDAVLLDVRTPPGISGRTYVRSKNVPLQQLDNIASVASENKDIPLFVTVIPVYETARQLGYCNEWDILKVNNIGGSLLRKGGKIR